MNWSYQLLPTETIKTCKTQKSWDNLYVQPQMFCGYSISPVLVQSATHLDFQKALSPEPSAATSVHDCGLVSSAQTEAGWHFSLQVCEWNRHRESVSDQWIHLCPSAEKHIIQMKATEMLTVSFLTWAKLCHWCRSSWRNRHTEVTEHSGWANPLLLLLSSDTLKTKHKGC